MSRTARTRAPAYALIVILLCAAMVDATPSAWAAASTCSMGDASSAIVTGGQVPVLFVHGINSGPAMWDTYVQGRGKSLQTLAGEVPGAEPYVFNYHNAGLDWVTDSPIGPALAQTIACLGDDAQRKIVVVAHSMGGLATQFALSRLVAGRSVADRVATVVTLGTPFHGSRLLSVAQAARHGGDIVTAAGGDPEVAIALNATLAACAKWGTSLLAAGTLNPCGLAAVPDSPVGTDLQYDSPAIQALPPWPDTIRVVALAGDIEAAYPVSSLPPGGALPLPVRLPAFRQQLVPVGIGDVPVSLDSATSVGIPEEPVRCAAPLLSTIFSSPCWHVALPANPVLAGTVLAAVRAAVDAQHTPTVDWRNRAYTTDCDGALDQPLTAILQSGTATASGSGGYDRVDVVADAVATGDLTGDGRAETAVLLRCVPQPSNYTTQEIQVFTEDGHPLGGPLRASDLKDGAILPPRLDSGSLAIANGALQIGAKTYVDGDTHASGPSGSSVVTWRWDGQTMRR